MTRLIVSRLATLIPLMLIATSIVFFLVRFVPGDPVRIMVGGQRISPQNVESIRHQYRLDKPLLVQYGYWLDDLAHGSLGDSFRQRAPVRDLVLDRLPITLKLATYSFLISMIISIPLGIISALRRNSWVDVGASFFSLIGASSPVFFTSILLILIFAYKLNWMPALGQGDGGWDTVKHLTLPAIALGLSLAAITTRITRNGMIEALSQDYMVTARAKGLSPRSIVFKHALRNALVPIVTVAGSAIRVPARRHGAGRIHLRHRRTRIAAGRFGAAARLSGRAGRDGLHRDCLHRSQSDRRHPLCASSIPG